MGRLCNRVRWRFYLNQREQKNTHQLLKLTKPNTFLLFIIVLSATVNYTKHESTFSITQCFTLKLFLNYKNDSNVFFLTTNLNCIIFISNRAWWKNQNITPKYSLSNPVLHMNTILQNKRRITPWEMRKSRRNGVLPSCSCFVQGHLREPEQTHDVNTPDLHLTGQHVQWCKCSETQG